MLEIKYKSIEDLLPYARNSRTHSDAQVSQIAASIREFGKKAVLESDGRTFDEVSGNEVAEAA